MPGMADPRFVRSVVYLCDHNDEGALGLIVNKPLPGARFEDICRQMGLALPSASAPRVYFGGPVAPERGFILHSADHEGGPDSLRVSPTLVLSADQRVLRAISIGEGPKRFLFALGYSGWGAGQLENEIEQNGWLILPGNDGLIFEVDNERKWNAAGEANGIDFSLLSPEAGNA